MIIQEVTIELVLNNSLLMFQVKIALGDAFQMANNARLVLLTSIHVF